MISEVLIHPTAVVSPSAELGTGVEIGAYAVIGAGVRLGDGTKVMSHAVIEGSTSIGKNCVIYPFACLGTAGQDKKAKGIMSGVVIGDQNEIREYVTINAGTLEGSKTVIGNRNLLMASTHVAHNCELGNDIVIANASALAGHVTIEDQAVLSGFVGVHQFVRIGRLSMTGGLSKITQDILPFSVCDGNPARFRGLNVVGLKRAGFSSSDCVKIKKAVKHLVHAGIPLRERIEALKSEFTKGPEIEALISFAANSKRGFIQDIPELPQEETA